MIYKCPFCGSVKKPRFISPYPIKLVKCQDCGKISAERKFDKYTNTDNSSQRKALLIIKLNSIKNYYRKNFLL